MIIDRLRGRLEKIRSLLEVSQRHPNCARTRLLSYSGIRWDERDLFNSLFEAGLISYKVNFPSTRAYFSITKKGFSLLNLFDKIEEMLKPEDVGVGS